MHISRHQVTEVEPHQFVAEASSLGLHPGEWPNKMFTFIGNGQPFCYSFKKLTEDGDLAYVSYRQALGCITLKVFND